MTSNDNPAAVDARSDSVSLSFFGATGTVTGSRYPSEFKAKPRKVFITHGEPVASAALASRFGQELGWDCDIPVRGEKVQL